MHSIVVDRVSKHWNGTAAAEEVSFTVEAAHLVALLGPSGCGKSTTLRLIAGLDSPTSGRIVIAGRDVTALPPAKRGISMVFQSYALFLHLSVAENVLFGLKVRNVARAERDARLAKAADVLGLKPLLERRPSQLSGGQQQRVALARAIVAEAAVCLMDEPLSNLDGAIAAGDAAGDPFPPATPRHDDDLRHTRSGRGHDDGGPRDPDARRPRRAECHAGRALWPPRARPLAARFVGTPPMNVMPGTVLAGCDWALPGSVTRSLDDLSFGVRPEAVRLDPEGVTAEIVASEYLGADTLIETRIGGVPFVARAAGRVDMKAGDTVHLAWSAADAHWFDRTSEQRIV